MQQNNWLNAKNRYGWLSILLHWSMAIGLIGMYFLGEYMTDLDYYDQWYHTAPAIHKAVGVILGILIILRLIWNHLQHKPEALTKINPLIDRMAQLAHLALYLLVILLVISGYLISTAKGQGIDVFGWFEIPALLNENADRGEIAGDIHEVLASLFFLLVWLHAIAALVHHFIFKDRTLKRMLWVNN